MEWWKIQKRLPGGDKFYQLFARGKLKKTPYEDLMRYFLVGYFCGYGRVLAWVFDYINKRFLKDGLWDFGIMKFIPLGKGGECCEVLDLIFPYLEDGYTAEIAADLGEGPYEMFDVFLKEGDVVIDAGANVGIFTVFATKCRKTYVHAFEPLPQAIDVLKANLDNNQVGDRVNIVPMCLADTLSESVLYIPEGNLGGASLACV